MYTEEELIEFGNLVLRQHQPETAPKGVPFITEVSYADLAFFKENLAKKPVTEGMKAVGISFNPANSPTVDRVKRGFGLIIDEMNYLRDTTVSKGVARHASIAIADAETAQMRAVKAITWKD